MSSKTSIATSRSPYSAAVLAPPRTARLTPPRIPHPPSEQLTISLARYAYASAEVREGREERRLFHTYKRLPGDAPKTLQLLDPRLAEPAPLFQRNPALENLRLPTRGATENGIKMPALQYEIEVLTLRTGDIVSDGKRALRLGDFLGAGNVSHIYANADDPSRVVKIPFAAGAMVYDANPFGTAEETPRHPIEYPRQFLASLNELRPLYAQFPDLAPVEIYETGANNSFLEAERVEVRELGHDFLSRKRRGVRSMAASDAHQMERLEHCLLCIDTVRRDRRHEWVGQETTERLLGTLPDFFPILRVDRAYRLLQKTEAVTWSRVWRFLQHRRKQSPQFFSSTTLTEILNQFAPVTAPDNLDARQLAWTGLRWRLLDWE